MHLLFIFGTRPEAIKMAPIIKHLASSDRFKTTICVTGQHDFMLNQVLDLFEIVPHHNLKIMKPNQSLTSIISDVLNGVTQLLEEIKPDFVLVQGDTSSAFSAALAAFYQKISVAHVEAGLRSGDRYSPWPEEMNRKLVTPLAHLHFAPTIRSYKNLRKEGVSRENIEVSGNTVIDALLYVNSLLESNESLMHEQELKFPYLNSEKKLILVTGHRRENFGREFENICHALKRISMRKDVQLIYPVHLNPNVQEPVKRLLSQSENIFLIDPLSYLSFVYLLKRSHFILTDSGGIQEEAPSLGKPVLVMRQNTERPEAIISGTSKLVGTDEENIVREASQLFDDPVVYQRMSKAHNPYGDGKASQYIVDRLLRSAV